MVYLLLQNPDEIETLHSAKLKKTSQERDSRLDGEEEDKENGAGESNKIEIPGERATTDTVMRGPESTIHTALENLHLDSRVRLTFVWTRIYPAFANSVDPDQLASEEAN